MMPQIGFEERKCRYNFSFVDDEKHWIRRRPRLAGRLLVVHCAAGTDGVVISHRTGFETAARPVWYTDE